MIPDRTDTQTDVSLPDVSLPDVSVAGSAEERSTMYSILGWQEMEVEMNMSCEGNAGAPSGPLTKAYPTAPSFQEGRESELELEPVISKSC